MTVHSYLLYIAQLRLSKVRYQIYLKSIFTDSISMFIVLAHYPNDTF